MKYTICIRPMALAVVSLLATHSGVNAVKTPTPGQLNYASIGAEITRITLTNIAMTQHGNSTAAAPLHALANIAGIVNDIVEYSIQENHKIPFKSTRSVALVTSLSTHVVDLVTHMMNTYNSLSYAKIKTGRALAVRGTQALELLISYLGHFGSTSIYAKEEFRATMLHLHAMIEAAEKVLLLQAYESSIIDETIYENYLKATIAVNLMLAGYQGINTLPKAAPVDPVIENPIIENPIIENPVIENPVIENPIIENPVDLIVVAVSESSKGESSVGTTTSKRSVTQRQASLTAIAKIKKAVRGESSTDTTKASKRGRGRKKTTLLTKENLSIANNSNLDVITEADNETTSNK